MNASLIQELSVCWNNGFRKKIRLSRFILFLLFNKYLTSGLFATDFKNAVVCPRLKKEWLDASQLKNY